MTPVWVFPAYPLLLSAPFGGNLVSAASRAGQLDGINTVPVALAAITVQGTGFLISFMICAAFLYRLMTQKLPRDHQRPGVFISIGPSGFTCAGLGTFLLSLFSGHFNVKENKLTSSPPKKTVQLGSQTSSIFPPGFAGTQHAADIVRLLSYMGGLWLWGLSIWFFLVSVGSLWKYLRPESKGKLRFQMTWFSFVFPNTALVSWPFSSFLVPCCSFYTCLVYPCGE